MIAIMNQIINSRATQSIFTDAYVNRPSASALKYGLFIDNTGVEGLFYSNGLSWTKVAGIGGGGGGSQTFQQVLNTGNILVPGQTQNIVGGGTSFLWDNFSSYGISTTDFNLYDSAGDTIIGNWSNVLKLGKLNAEGRFDISNSISGYTEIYMNDLTGITTGKNYLQIVTDPSNRAYRFGDFKQSFAGNYIEIIENGVINSFNIVAPDLLNIFSTTKIQFNADGFAFDNTMVTITPHNNKSIYHLKVNIAGSGISYAIPIYMI